jgi:Uma2 family endonuclease
MEFEQEHIAPIETITQMAVLSNDKDNEAEKQYKRQRGKPTPSRNHTKLQRRIADALHAQYGAQYDFLPEFEIELLKKSSVPDISVFPFKESDWDNDELRSKEPPILAVEIHSPRQILGDVLKKIRNNYFPAGVQSAWVILPALKTITLMHPNGKIQNYNEGILNDDAIGFNIDINEVFK